MDNVDETKANSSDVEGKIRWYKKPLYINTASIFALIVLVVTIVLNSVHVDQVLIEPGTADELTDIITFKDVKTYPSDGTIRFLTVYVSAEKPTLSEYLKAKYIDDDTEIISWEKVNGDQTTQQLNELNSALMAQSQNTAMVVALEKLGCEIAEHGTGAVVTEVLKGSPASENIEIGDVITAVGDEKISIAEDLSNAIVKHKKGDTVPITVERGKTKKEFKFEVTLSSREDNESQAFLGVAFFTRDQKLDFPVDISISTGDVSGPSAGLAFTLTIIDKLTPGDLTGGKDIAATGEISGDGSVGQVGGVSGKAVTARKAGVDIMLVPAGEGKEAKKKSQKMKVVEVDSIDDALEVLEKNGGAPISHMQSCPSK